MENPTLMAINSKGKVEWGRRRVGPAAGCSAGCAIDSYPNSAEGPALQGGDRERGERSSPCALIFLVRTKTRVLAFQNQVSRVNPRAAHARIACQVNPERGGQQQERYRDLGVAVMVAIPFL